MATKSILFSLLCFYNKRLRYRREYARPRFIQTNFTYDFASLLDLRRTAVFKRDAIAELRRKKSFACW